MRSIRRHRTAWAAAVIVLATLPTHAVTPLTPQLSDTTRQAIALRLTELQFPEVAHSSVVIALLGALGAEAATNTYVYDLPYPQLPKITARATPVSAGCAQVHLVARHAAAVEPMVVRLRGIYCLIGPARWQAQEQWLD